MNKMNKRIRIHNKILSLKKGLKNISLKKIKEYISYGRKY